MSESEPRRKLPDLVVASLGANRKDKPNGEVSARVHARTVGESETKQERRLPPNRTLREKSKLGELTFALSADVHTDIFPYIHKTGTVSGAKSTRGQTCSCTPWAHLEYRGHRIVSPESRDRFEDWRNSWLASSARPGICWWLTT